MTAVRPGRRSRRIKNYSLLAAIVLSALTLVTWTSQWYSLRLRESATGKPVLSITGDVAAPALVALALAGLALVAALAIAGPFFRAVLGVVQVVLGFTIALSSIIAIANPVQASASAITAATGVSGSKSVAALVQSVSPTIVPVLAAVLGILTLLLGVFVLVSSRYWPRSSSRYQQPVRLESAEPNGDAVSDWDSLSGGSDPTSR